ncbi:hypothetical protein KO481_33755 [Nocardia sp. NEAU-G5]|uniref:Uncharacterized protein n=1 Tax=Nocardia albiluteola TaxID=2842303 RepID=A0ABS6BAP0_9NOCA|nr:hypothetical protein [Nocardia albiluteola]MBU3066475.1 hypothetical protein [Nocardia albiluteola]
MALDVHRAGWQRFYCDYHKGSPWIVFAPLVAAGLKVRGLPALTLLR